MMVKGRGKAKGDAKLEANGAPGGLPFSPMHHRGAHRGTGPGMWVVCVCVCVLRMGRLCSNKMIYKIN